MIVVVERAVHVLRVGVCLLGLAAVGGCAVYANYPPVGDDWAVNDPNVSPLPWLVELSLGEVVEMTGPTGPYLINPPEGTDLEVARSIAAELPGRARIVSSETLGLPAYHVTRVWVRGDGAEVDVVHPVGERGVRGESINQLVTVRLERGFGGWRVRSTRVWNLTPETPELYGWGAEGEPSGPSSEPDENGANRSGAANDA